MFNKLKEMRIKPVEQTTLNGEKAIRFMVHTTKQDFLQTTTGHTHRTFNTRQFYQFARLMTVVQKINGLNRYDIRSETKGVYILFTNRTK